MATDNYYNFTDDVPKGYPPVHPNLIHYFIIAVLLVSIRVQLHNLALAETPPEQTNAQSLFLHILGHNYTPTAFIRNYKALISHYTAVLSSRNATFLTKPLPRLQNQQFTPTIHRNYVVTGNSIIAEELHSRLYFKFSHERINSPLIATNN